MTRPDIAIYGASGYTGKLIAEYCAKAGLSFRAIGRSAERVQQALSEVPGLDRVKVEVTEASHDQAALARAFAGARVVVNVVGPFGQLGRPVVDAACEVGAHYLDTTGEQDWVRELKAQDHVRFAARQLTLCPALAWMWTGGLIAAEIALETPGVDSLDILYAPNGAPTVASTLSFLRMVTKPQFRLCNNTLETWPSACVVKVTAPHDHEVLTGLPWGGGCEPLWFEDDPRVRNCRVIVAFPHMPLIDWVIQAMNAYVEAEKTKTDAELEDMTNEWGRQVAQQPPRENPEVNRCLIAVKARGTTHGFEQTYFNTSPYLQTAAMIAEACAQLLGGAPRRTGFASPTQAFGARRLADALAEVQLHQPIGSTAALQRVA
jgi:short subunit dehydrogenase-like uncharacterized protein